MKKRWAAFIANAASFTPTAAGIFTFRALAHDPSGNEGSASAELQVLTVCVQPAEYLLLVERVYANHLVDWIAATVADMG